jgi:hypothetical protein
MSQNAPNVNGERLDENPYAPPQSVTGPAVEEKETDDAWHQRTKHIRRESIIRVVGLFGLILAGFVVLAFGLGTLSELYRQEEEGIPSWMHRRWVARMICVISIAVLAFVTNWGLFRLRNWGRWALTIVTTLPVPALVCGWLLLNLNANPGVQEGVNPAALTTLSVMSALCCPLLLFLMWSPRGEMVFSPEYSETIRQTPGSRAGCSGMLAALVVLSAELISYIVLLVVVLSILVILGLIRSV